MSEKNDGVVIYGSGIAGAVLAHRLSKTVDVTLVSPLDYFEIPMAMPRNLVQPEFAHQSVVPLDEVLPNVTKIKGRLKLLNEQGGLVETGEGEKLVQGAVTVLATGSRYATELIRVVSGSVAERRADYVMANQQLLNAERILIVGAGPIGIELAGEISEDFPDKKLVVVDSSQEVLKGISRKAARYAVKVLESRGVEFVLNQRLKNPPKPTGVLIEPPGEAFTESGRAIPYDALIWCIGGIPNTDYMQGTYSDLLNQQNRVRVTPHLQVQGQKNRYAIGDITDLNEVKKAIYIIGHLQVAEHNILSHYSSRPKAAKTYRAKTEGELMLLTLGRNAGVLSAPVIGTISWPWLIRIAKANDMLVKMYRKKVGATPAAHLPQEN